MFDHAHNLVIGETAKVGNNVPFCMQLLGGTGKFVTDTQR